MRAVAVAILLAVCLGLAADSPTVEAKEFAARMARSPHPVIVQVGFGYQYRVKHIPGSVYAGPGARPAGLDLLKGVVAKLPHDREIVIYCGCCPWEKCPNIKPVIDLLKSMGFTHVVALRIPTSFQADWIDQGYPVEQSEPAK